MPQVEDPDAAEWLGPKDELDEEGRAAAVPLPAGFLSATYRAGNERSVVLCFDVGHLPPTWSVLACGQDGGELLNQAVWSAGGRSERIVMPWQPVQPPEKLLVRWPGGRGRSGP